MPNTQGWNLGWRQLSIQLKWADILLNTDWDSAEKLDNIKKFAGN